MSSLRICSFFLLFFFIFSVSVKSQNDTDKIKIGPEELQSLKGGHYYNFSDKNKVNIEVMLLGGVAYGKYLIPEGTTLFDLIIMSGGANTYTMEDVKVVRFKTETPKMQGRDVVQYDYSGLFGDKEDILEAKSNPMLRAGDWVIVPEPKPDRDIFFYITQTITFIGTLVSFYYLIDNIVRRR